MSKRSKPPLQEGNEAQPPAVGGELAEAFRGLWGALVRRRRTMILVFVVVAVSVQTLAFFWPATYVARAAVLIQKNRYSGNLSPGGAGGATVISAGVSEEDVGSERTILTAREVLLKTLSATGLDKAVPPWYLRVLFAPIWGYDRLHAWWHEVPPPTLADRALRGLEGSISAEPIKHSNTMVISYQSGNPMLSQAVLGEIVKNYLAHHLEVHRRTGIERFFGSQAALLQEELSRREEELEKLQEDSQSADIDAERELYLQIDSEVRQEALEIERNIAELDERIASYQKTLSRAPAQMQTSKTESRNELVMQDLKDRMLQLEIERIRLLERYKPDSPLIEENEKKLTAARAAIDAEGKDSVARMVTGISPMLIATRQEVARAKAERAGAVRRLEEVGKQVKASRERIVDLSGAVLGARRIRRLIDATELQYLQYLRRSTEARIDNALDTQQFSNVSIIQGATADPKPIRPKKLWSLIFALGGGLVAALAVAIVLEVRAWGLEAVLDSVTPRQ